jgi:hypothetical protein
MLHSIYLYIEPPCIAGMVPIYITLPCCLLCYRPMLEITALCSWKKCLVASGYAAFIQFAMSTARVVRNFYGHVAMSCILPNRCTKPLDHANSHETITCKMYCWHQTNWLDIFNDPHTNMQSHTEYRYLGQSQYLGNAMHLTIMCKIHILYKG